MKGRYKNASFIIMIVLSLILIIAGCKKRLALFLPGHSERTIKTIDKEFKHDPNERNIADIPLTR